MRAGRRTAIDSTQVDRGGEPVAPDASAGPGAPTQRTGGLRIGSATVQVVTPRALAPQPVVSAQNSSSSGAIE
jgi:hypothetical protein